jgi:hypothetical protein
VLQPRVVLDCLLNLVYDSWTCEARKRARGVYSKGTVVGPPPPPHQFFEDEGSTYNFPIFYDQIAVPISHASQVLVRSR